MQNNLAQTLEVLKKINSKLSSTIISKKDFLEEEENIHDFIKENESLLLLLRQLKESKLDNEAIFCEQIVNLHLFYASFIWHFEQMHELIIKIMHNFNTDSKIKFYGNLDRDVTNN